MNPTMIAIMLSTIKIQWAPSAKCIASLPKSLWWTNTKNKMREMREPTNMSKPKNSPFEAPTQSTLPCCACASAIALRDNTISRRCSRSSCVTYLKNRLYHHCFKNSFTRTTQSRVRWKCHCCNLDDIWRIIWNLPFPKFTTGKTGLFIQPVRVAI